MKHEPSSRTETDRPDLFITLSFSCRPGGVVCQNENLKDYFCNFLVMESLDEPRKRVVLWNPGYARSRSGGEQITQLVILFDLRLKMKNKYSAKNKIFQVCLFITLVLGCFAESQTSGVGRNEAMGIIFFTAVSTVFTLFVFLVSIFNLPNTLVIIATRKEAYLAYTV